MAVVTTDFIAGLFTNYNVVWEQALLRAAETVEFNRYALTVDSNTDTESYNWLGNVPQMKQWVDERKIQNLYAYNYSLTNLLYEDTIEVKRTTIADDKYNTIRPRIAQMGQEAAIFPARQSATTLANGLTATCYDGSAFFATTHSEGLSGTQSNKLTGTGTTLAQFRADFLAARVAMRRYKDDQGVTMNLGIDLVLVPPELQDVAEQLINSNLIASPTTAAPSNVLKGAADIFVDANLTDANDWYAMDTKQVMKPLIYQIREAPEFTSLDQPDNPQVFMRDRYLYGVRARFALGYGVPSMCIVTTNS